MTEEQMIKMALEESMKVEEKKDNFATVNLEDAFLKTVMQMSQNDNLDKNQLNIGVQFALENGFTLEQAIEAQSIVGDDPELMISYLFDKMALK